jgi:predicted ATPase/DNA-binding CsgD family transcriptional regulator
LTNFVGREQELTEIQMLLRRTRLLTLTGPGGSGKTRLTLQATAEASDRFEHGVFFVGLGPLFDPGLVIPMVAQVLGVPDMLGRPPLEHVQDYLRDRRLLLLLDNCEHLVGACAELADALLRACPHLRILATSREVLGVAGETVYPVPPLTLPPPGDAVSTPTDERLAASEAVQLFVTRAAEAMPGFALSERNAPAVAEVCRRLDGMPLALELAAARIRVLAPEQIAARLEDRFRLLTGGSRMAVPRQRTLRATLDWSYELLSEPERALFRRLAVFAGGFTLEGAEAVGGEPADAPGPAPDEPPVATVLDLLARLADKSMVVAEPTAEGPVGYRLLETVRQYGWERLAECGEAAAARRRHAHFYLECAEVAEPELVGRDQLAWADRLEREHDNLRAALRWFAESGESAAELRLSGALWRFWFVHSHLAEGRQWVEAALARGGAAPAAARARALCALAYIVWAQGDFPEGSAYAAEGLALYRELGDKPRMGDILGGLALTTLFGGDLDRAGAWATEGRAVSREAAYAHGTGIAVGVLGAVAQARGDDEQAAALSTEGVAVLRELGDREGAGLVLEARARITHGQGRGARATTLYGECLELYRQTGDRQAIARCLDGLAALAASQGRLERAARLFGAEQALREAIGAALVPVDRAERDRGVAEARRALGEAAYQAAWAEGRAWPLERALDEALAPPAPAPAQSPRRAPDPAASPLTAREREIAALIGRGLTSREIAEALVLSERTVDNHADNIRGKLGLRSRAEIAAWAARQGLLDPPPATA